MIASIRWLVPLHCHNRLLGRIPGRVTNITDSHLTHYRSENDIKERRAALLCGIIEGGALRDSVLVTNQHYCVADGTP